MVNAQRRAVAIGLLADVITGALAGTLWVQALPRGAAALLETGRPEMELLGAWSRGGLSGGIGPKVDPDAVSTLIEAATRLRLEVLGAGVRDWRAVATAKEGAAIANALAGWQAAREAASVHAA